MYKKLIVALAVSFLLISLMSLTTAAQNEIVLWDINTEAEAERVVLQDAIERFEADNPDYVIRHVPTSNDDYKTKLQVAMGADNEPDIFLTWGGGPLKEYVDADKVLDITDELDQDNWRDRFVPAGLELAEFYDRNYGIPVVGMRVILLFYRSDIFDEVGIEAPETYEEFKEIIAELNNAGYIPLALANQNRWTGSMYYMYLVDRLGGEDVFINAAQRNEGASFTDEAFIRAGEIIQELVDLNAFPGGVNGLNEDQGQSRQLLYANRAAMYLMGDWAYGSVMDENPDMLEHLDFFSFPVFEDGQGDPSNLIGSPAGNMYHVSKTAEHKEGAIEFLKYLSDERTSEYMVEIGNLAPFSDVEQHLDDPFMVRIYNELQNANHVQLYYDQYLPPQIAQAHLDTMHGLFDKSLSPEEAAERVEQAARNYYDE